MCAAPSPPLARPRGPRGGHTRSAGCGARVSLVRLGAPAAPSGSGRLPPLFPPTGPRLTRRRGDGTGTPCRPRGRLCRAGPPERKGLACFPGEFSSASVLPVSVLESLPFQPAFGFPTGRPRSSAGPSLSRRQRSRSILASRGQTDVASPSWYQRARGGGLALEGQGGAGTDGPLDGRPLTSPWFA